MKAFKQDSGFLIKRLALSLAFTLVSGATLVACGGSSPLAPMYLPQAQVYNQYGYNNAIMPCLDAWPLRTSNPNILKYSCVLSNISYYGSAVSIFGDMPDTGLSLLAPGQGAPISAFNFRSGDRVTIITSDGRWGDADSNHWGACKSETITQPFDSQYGLQVSDGTTVYSGLSSGAGGSVSFTIPGAIESNFAQMVTFGVNVPSTSLGCARFTFKTVQVERCVLGQSVVACPAI